MIFDTMYLDILDINVSATRAFSSLALVVLAFFPFIKQFDLRPVRVRRDDARRPRH